MADSDEPQAVEKLRGRVTCGEYARGSKSEREAVFVETAKGRFILRRKTGPVYADKALEKYVGRTVECSGFLVGSTLLAEKISIVS